jgi:hypothetical protein
MIQQWRVRCFPRRHSKAPVISHVMKERCLRSDGVTSQRDAGRSSATFDLGGPTAMTSFDALM